MDGATQVGGLYYDLDIPTDKLDKSLDQSDKKVHEFGDNSAKTGEAIKSGLNKAALGFTAVGAGLTLVSKDATDFTVARVKEAKVLSQQIGTSVEEASRLTAAFTRMGVTSDKTNASFSVFSKNIVESTKNVDSNKIAFDKLNIQIESTKKEITDTSKEIKLHGDKSGDLNLKLKVLNNTLSEQQQQLKESTDGFSKLGISTIDAQGKQKGFNTLLFEVSDKFKALPDGIDKTTLSMDLFGKQGKDLLPVLDLGSQGIKDLESQADKLGLTLNANTIGKINDLVESQKNLKEQTDALKISIGTATAPVLTEFNTKVNDVLASLLATDSPVKDLTTNVLAFGGPALSFIGSAIGIAANLVTVADSATLAKGSILGLQLTAAAGVVLPTAGAIAAVLALKEAIDFTQNSLNKLVDNLNKTKVKINNSNLNVSGGSQTGLIQQLRNAFSGFAEGTNFAPGGLSWVGEHGPELMNVPHGAQIIPSDVSKSIATGSQVNQSTQVSVDLRGASFRDRSDIRYMMDLLGRNVELAAQGMPPLRSTT